MKNAPERARGVLRRRNGCKEATPRALPWTTITTLSMVVVTTGAFTIDRVPSLPSHQQHRRRHRHDTVAHSSVLDDDESSTTSSNASTSPTFLSSLTKDGSLSELPPQQLVLEAMNELFPPQALADRMALSRKDGYWKYIASGEEPPPEFVYGEFDTRFFVQVLQRAGEILVQNNGNRDQDQEQGSTGIDFSDWTFCDLGSGTGRLVLTAAGLFPWKLCRGIELLEGIHTQAVETLESCRVVEVSGGGSSTPTTTSVEQQQPPPDEVAPAVSISPMPSSCIDNDVGSDHQQSGYWEQYQQYVTRQEEEQQQRLAQEEQKQQLRQASLFSEDNDDHDHDHDQEAKQVNNNLLFALYHSALDLSLPLAPIELSCGSFTDPYEFWGDANIVFCFSSALPYTLLIELAHALGRQCRPGTLVITTEYQLPTSGTIPPLPEFEDDPNVPRNVDYKLELVDTLTGENESTGGLSTVYIQRLIQSYGDGIPKTPPVLSVSEVACRAIRKVEQDQEQSQTLFLRNVSNQMIFMGFPESWLPKRLRRTNNDWRK